MTPERAAVNRRRSLRRSRAIGVRPRYFASSRQEATAEAREQLQQVGGAVPDAPQIAHGRADVTRASSPTPHPRPHASPSIMSRPTKFAIIICRWQIPSILQPPRRARHDGVGASAIRDREACATGCVAYARMGPSNLLFRCGPIRATRPAVRSLRDTSQNVAD